MCSLYLHYNTHSEYGMLHDMEMEVEHTLYTACKPCSYIQVDIIVLKLLIWIKLRMLTYDDAYE